MENDSPQAERRKHQRYQVPNLTIAIPKKSHSQVARIVNISKGGMAVRYLDQKDWLGEAQEIDILVSSNLLISSIPIETIKDFKLNDQASFSIIRERQCCLQFGSLSPAQKSLLDEFIINCSAGNS